MTALRPALEIALPALHPSQQEIATHDARFKVVCCGRRWGKTLLSAVLALRAAVHGGRVWHIGPTYKQAQEGWMYAKLLAAQIPGTIIREGDMEARLPTGGVLQVRTASDPDNLRGAGLDGLVIDEAAIIDEELWSKVLRPALSDRHGWAMFISTPQGNNWFRRLHDEAKSRNDWASWQLPSWDRPTFDRSEVEAAKADGMSDEEIEQEFGASFLVSQDTIYPQFSRARHLSLLPQGPWRGGAIGADYGDVHPSTVVAVTVAQDGRYWVRGCWYGDGDTARWMSQVSEQCGKYGIARNRVRVDPTQRAIASAYYLNPAEMGDGARRSRIGLVKGLFNRHALMFDWDGPGIVRLAGELENYRWDRFPDGTLKDSPRRIGEDGVAALEYAIEELEGSKPNPYADPSVFRSLGTPYRQKERIVGGRR